MNFKNWKQITALAVLLSLAIAAMSVGIACRGGKCANTNNTSSSLRGVLPPPSQEPSSIPTYAPTSGPVDQHPQPTTTAPSSPSASPTTTTTTSSLRSQSPTNSPTSLQTWAPTMVDAPPPPLTDGLINVTRLEPTNEDFARFGGSLALDGNFMIVGADGDDATGRAFVYEKDQTSSDWMLLQVLQQGRGGDGFGYSVSIHRDRLVVGAPYCDPDGYEQYRSESAGCAYVYRYQNGQWQLEIKLESSMMGNAHTEQFGYSVAIHGNVVAVSAPKWFSQTGQVYLFRKPAPGQAWQQEQTLQGTTNGINSLFGWQIAMDARRIVVGCVREDEGSAYVFARSSRDEPFELEQKLIPLEPVARWFGQGVAIDRNTIVVGRPQTEGFNMETGESHGGGAYIFTKGDDNTSKNNTSSAWTQRQILRRSTVGNDYFGTGVAIHGDNIVIGAPNGEPDDTCFTAPPSWNNATFCLGNLGIAYTYTRSHDNTTIIINDDDDDEDDESWTLVQALYEQVSFDAGKDFGMALDIQNDVVAIGARKAGVAHGRVVVFESPAQDED